MRSPRSGTPLASILLSTMLLLFAGNIHAQNASTRRLRGVIDSVAGDALIVTTNGGQKVSVGLTSATPVVLVAPLQFSAVKPGSYIGTAAVSAADGTLRALEVHVFAENMRGVGEGHTPWGSEPQSTMTNGTVGEVAGTDGRTLHVTYKGGEQTVVVDPETPIVAMERASHDVLTPGAHASVSATVLDDGKLRARFVAVGKNGFEPPI